MAEVPAEVVTSDVSVAPAADAAPAPDSTAEQVTEASEGGEKPVAPERTFTQSELDAINARTKAQADRRALKAAARIEAERDLLKQQLAEARNPVQRQTQDGAPKLEDFQGNYEKYLIAQAKHEFRQEQEQREKETAGQREARETHQVMAQKSQILNDRIDAIADEIPEIRDILSDDTLPFTEPMTAAVLELESGSKVMGYLATHRDEAAKMAKLSPVNQVIAAYELGKKLTTAPRPTQTPAPIVPTQGKASVEKRLEEATSQEEFNAIRRKQIAARQGRFK